MFIKIAADFQYTRKLICSFSRTKTNKKKIEMKIF